MSQRMLAVSLLALVICTGSLSAEQLPADAVALYDAIYPSLQPAVQRWIVAEAKSPRLAQAPPPAVAPLLRDAIRTRFSGFDLPPSDIDELVALIVIASIREMNSDKHAYLQKLKAIEEAKKDMRELRERLTTEIARNNGKAASDPCLPPLCGDGISRRAAAISSAQRRNGLTPILTPIAIRSVGDLKTLQTDLDQKHASMRDAGEMESLQLQKMMQRSSKLLETLSAIAKATSKRNSSMLRNLK